MNKMVASKEAKEIAEMTAEETVQSMTIEDAPVSIEIVAEILKSMRTPRPKKDKHPMILVRVSPRNCCEPN